MAEQDIWAPLGRSTFRALWIASVVSNVGTWVHDTAAGWTMTIIAPTPTLVSMMQTATSLPFFVLALPSGTLADIELVEAWVARHGEPAPSCTSRVAA